jgi:hypothetical protein
VIGSLLLFTAGCSEPPQKEIDLAQAAVDGARDAGAERYASGEFVSARASLDKAKAAVDQRDYRQALNYALDSRQRAAEASRQAVEGKARAKRDIEARYGEASTRANALATALRNASANGVSPKTLKVPQAVLAAARADLQKASASISAGNYEDASNLLTQVRGKLDAAIAEVEKIPPPRPARRRSR